MGLFVLYLYSCRRGKCLQRSWARVSCLSGYAMDHFVYFRDVHLKCCLVVCLPSVRLLVWCETGVYRVLLAFKLIYGCIDGRGDNGDREEVSEISKGGERLEIV